ncbi:MAG TPA: ABC transporter permease [Streptosporangiaceae bacterium]|jgi:ABC-type antimicrobial peptide transport system permease subunit
MFFTYLRRELRRRMRQAVFIALGLALGIGLVITVTAASAGVKNAQGSVLHSLYGVGTDITVTKTPKAGSGAPGSFGFRGRFGSGSSRPKSGTKIDVDTLSAAGLGTLADSSVSTVANLHDVAAVAGGLTLTDTKVTGKIPAFSTGGNGGGGFPGGGGGSSGNGGGGSFRGSFSPKSFSVQGVDLGTGELGPLSSGKIASGRTLRSSDSSSDVALVDSNYATQNKLATGSTVTIAKKSFKVVGIVSEPSGSNGSDVYIPLARAQALATGSNGKAMTSDVNTIYVAAASSSDIGGVQKAISANLPGSTVTTQSSLASQVTGSLSSAASLANNLGKWLAVAVLIAAFGLAALLTMAAVSRRVREFGTLKALGWPGRRVVGQVMGESLVVGIVGGLVGVGLGFAGAALVGKFAPPLTAQVGSATGSASPGGSRVFGGGFPGGGGGFPGGGGGAPGGAGNAFRRLADASQTVAVHLTAPVTITAIVIAVLLAVAGGLVAGGFGGWRASRLRPADALTRVE